MSGGSNKSSTESQQTSTQALDPQIKAALLSNYNRALGLANAPYQPYTGQRVAGLSGQQTQAQNLFGNIASTPNSAIQSGIDAAGAVAGYQPQNVFAPTSKATGYGANLFGSTGYNASTYNPSQAGSVGIQGSTYNPATIAGAPTTTASTYNPASATSQGYQAANAGSSGYNPNLIKNTALATGVGATTTNANAATLNRGSVRDVTTGPVSDAAISHYLNPYTNDVVNAQAADLERQRQIEQTYNNAKATAAHAFGGTGAAVLASGTNDNYARAQATSSAQLRQAAYESALGAGQTDLARQLAADQGNQGADLSVAGTNTANQQATNLFNAQNNTDTSRFNANLFTGVNSANADRLNNTSGLNQSALNAAGQFGANASNTAQLANAAAQNQAGQFGANASNTAQLANADAANTAGQFNATAQNANSQSSADRIMAVLGLNQAAQNQAGQYNATNAQNANLFTAGAQNTASLANADAANQAGATNAAAQNAAGAFGANAANAAAAANAGAQNQAGQFNAAAQNTSAQQNADRILQALQSNQSAGLAGAGLNLQAANSLGTLGQAQSSDVLQKASALMASGQVTQQQQQAILDAAYQQYGDAQNWPLQLQQLLNQSLGLAGNPTLTQSQGTSKGSSSGWNFNLFGGGGGGISGSDIQAVAGA